MNARLHIPGCDGPNTAFWLRREASERCADFGSREIARPERVSAQVGGYKGPKSSPFGFRGERLDC